MLTGMTERDWLIALEVFDAVQSFVGPSRTIDIAWPSWQRCQFAAGVEIG
jgi:hypothetical protein